ncbi:MAG: hypothetical protein ABR936_11890 [Bacteroidota bacterium]
MIIINGNLCIDDNIPMSCPLQPAILMEQKKHLHGAYAGKQFFTRQPCVTNCAQFIQNDNEDGTIDILLGCCDRQITNVRIKTTGGN